MPRSLRRSATRLSENRAIAVQEEAACATVGTRVPHQGTALHCSNRQGARATAIPYGPETANGAEATADRSGSALAWRVLPWRAVTSARNAGREEACRGLSDCGLRWRRSLWGARTPDPSR